MTAASLMGPLQAAVFALLAGDPAFCAGDAGYTPLVQGVYDEAPEGALFPYVSFGETSETSADCFGQDGCEDILTLHIWSRAPGFQEAQAINAAMITLLDGNTALEVAGYDVYLLNYESTNQLRDPDGKTRHLVTRFRVMADAT